MELDKVPENKVCDDSKYDWDSDWIKYPFHVYLLDCTKHFYENNRNVLYKNIIKNSFLGYTSRK